MKNNKTKLAKALTSALVVAAISTTPFFSNHADATANFKDVPNSAFYEKAVYELSEKGVIGGYKDGTFQPNKAVTRAEAAKMLAYDLGLTTPNQSTVTFSDVNKENWFYKSVTALSQAGGIRGYENGTFQPNKTITRAEMASMLVKAYSLKGTNSTQSNFKDISAQSWYAQAVQTLFENKVTSGKPGNLFAPNDQVTRGEIAAFIHKVNQAKEGQNTSISPSNIIKNIAADQSITIGSKTYKASTSLNGLLNSKNAAILQNAKIEFKESNGTITDITYLQINSSGQASDQEFSKNVVLDGLGNTINGKLEINANYITLKNLVVNGDLEITANLKNDFYSEKLTVKGKTIVNGGDDNTVVFKDASLGTVAIQKKDVRVVPKGQTSVKEISISSNATVAADENVTIPKVTVNSGANIVQLDGKINIVELKNKEAVTLKGNASIKEAQIINGATLSLAVKNKIEKVTVETGGKLSISADTAIGDLKLPSGSKVTDIVTNYENSKNNIEKQNGENNPDYKAPARSVGGGGGGGAVTPSPSPSATAIENILSSYADDLEGLKNNANTELNTILQNNNYISLIDLYKSTKSSFESKYEEIEKDLLKTGLSETEAKEKVKARYTQLSQWKTDVYNKLINEGFSQELLDKYF